MTENKGGTDELTDEQQDFLLDMILKFMEISDCTDENIYKLLNLLEQQIAEFEFINKGSIDA